MISEFAVFRLLSLGNFLLIFLVNQSTVSTVVFGSEKFSCGDHKIPVALQKSTVCFRTLKCIFFSIFRQNIKNIYHHLGIYCYHIETLKKFVSLKQSSNEIKNKLEQLRALDNKLKINVALAKSSPIGVDTEEDYLAIKKIMEYKI